MAKSILASLNFNYLYRKQKIEHVDGQYQLKYLSLANKSLQYVHQENLPALEKFLAAIIALRIHGCRILVVPGSYLSRATGNLAGSSPTCTRSPERRLFGVCTHSLSVPRNIGNEPCHCADRNSALYSAYRMRHSACT